MRFPRLLPSVIAGLLLGAAACDEPAEEPPPAPEPEVESAAAETAAETEDEPEPDEAEVEEADEFCARAVVVAWQGAAHAAEAITRSQTEARTRAEELLARVDGGESIADVAREASDASSSGPRGGLLGTYTRDDWPGAHQVLLDPVATTPIGGRTQVIEASYGYVFAERCPVEKVHTRHILIRFAGARNAGEDITRSRDAARQLADTLRVDATAAGADFGQLATDRSEDASAERGGDLGSVGRGRLSPAYEEAAFALAIDEVSEVVESDFGFHIIQRLAE